MLTEAMNEILSPLYDASRVKFVPMALPAAIGPYMLPNHIWYPLEVQSVAGAGERIFSPDEMAAGAVYVLCYQPLHKDAATYRQLARAYIQTFSPDSLTRMFTEAREARKEGDWVGTIGRLWTILQIDPLSPDVLAEMAFSALQLGFVASKRGDVTLAARLAKVSGAALNTLHQYFPDYGPGHFCRAEFLLASGDTTGAVQALHQALRLGLPPETALEAKEMLGEIMG